MLKSQYETAFNNNNNKTRMKKSLSRQYCFLIFFLPFFKFIIETLDLSKIQNAFQCAYKVIFVALK